MKKCIRCGVTDVKLYKVVSETSVYKACNLCLVAGINALKKIAKRTDEESSLLLRLEEVVGRNHINA
jgi:hypothetical protein